MQILEFITLLRESTHIEHPEDLVFTQGSQGAARAMQALNSVIAQPKNLTIKWDGFPAIIFGRNVDGQLTVADKHMFTKGDGSGRNITSLQQFIAYDQARGVDRGDLYQKLNVLWPGLEQAVPTSSRGYYWGDLLWAGMPSAQNNEYVFRPNTVTYHIPVLSELGKRISKSTGGVVVHQFFADFDSPPQVLNGTGDLNLSGPLCVLTPQINDKIVLKSPVQQLKKADSAISKYGAAVDQLIDPTNLASFKMKDLPALMKMYINFKVRGGTSSFLEWLPAKLSTAKHERMYGVNQDGYLHQNIQGLEGAFVICDAVAAVKNNIVAQLDTQQKTVQASINGQSGGEGYVVSTPQGLLKLVNRSMFSAANFAKNP
jgi:hypothetical protein